MHISGGVASTDSSRKIRVDSRAILRVTAVAALWGGFLSWSLVVMDGDALLEAAKAVSWLLRVIGFYLGALALWVIYNRVLHTVRGPSKIRIGEVRALDKDYFGRPVSIAAGTRFSDQHLVLEYLNSQKVYRAPTAEEAGEADETLVASDVKALATAAGVHSFSASQSQETGTEEHARGL